MTGKAAYEEGIKSSFEYWGVSSFATVLISLLQIITGQVLL